MDDVVLNPNGAYYLLTSESFMKSEIFFTYIKVVH
jgi:hypothetical protein